MSDYPLADWEREILKPTETASGIHENGKSSNCSDSTRKPQEEPITEEIGHDTPTVEKSEPRFEVPEAAKGYVPTTDEVRDNYDPSMAPRFRRMRDVSIDDPEYGSFILFEREMLGAEFDRWLQQVQAEAWRNGHRAAWEASGDGWNGEINGISGDYDELVRGGMFEDNPYESEEK